MPQSPNHLLAKLPRKVFADLQSHLKLVELTHGDVLAEAGATLNRVYFPHSGIISLVVDLTVGEMIETAMVGRDGVFYASAAFDSKVSLNRGIVQLAGVASVIDADQLSRIADKDKPFRSLLIRHDLLLFSQAQQSAACNARHKVEARMCRWLLRMRDLAGSDDLQLTQEFLGQMMGVRRTSVSIVAGTLQKTGLIRYKRGNISILNVPRIRKRACECYETVKGHYHRLLPA
jgi:CRP-like cAMP-binding protein